MQKIIQIIYIYKTTLLMMTMVTVAGIIIIVINLLLKQSTVPGMARVKTTFYQYEDHNSIQPTKRRENEKGE